MSIAVPTHIQDLRVTQQLGHWRFVFDANHALHVSRYFRLKHPNRWVVDIQQATMLAPFHSALRTRSSPVKQIRHSERPGGGLRLVFDLNQSVNAKVFTLPATSTHKNRLVVDFKTHGAALPLVQTKATLKTRQRPIMIVIDPGHGGKDPGASGPRGTHEKSIVLAIAKDLKKILNQQRGFKAVLTRRGDYYISLRRRLAIARRYHPDLFIAIHADAFHNRRAHGASVYALSRRGATSEAARWLAKRENASELMGGVNLSDKGNLLKSVLISLSQTATIRASLLIGQQLIGTLDDIAALHHHRVEQAAFVVLKSPDIPSLLVETGFLSNPHEERRLRTPAYRHRIALALMKGIKQYFSQRPPRGTLLALHKAK